MRLSVRKYLVLCYARDCYRLGPWMQEVVGVESSSRALLEVDGGELLPDSDRIAGDALFTQNHS